MAAKKKPLSKRGLQTKAGVLLSRFLREIALEETEFIKVPGGEDRMVTKAEALVRIMFERALGYTETKRDDSGVAIEIDHPPDKYMIAMVFERIEGKAPISADGTKGRRSVVDKVTEQGKNRLNNLATDSVKKKKQ